MAAIVNQIIKIQSQPFQRVTLHAISDIQWESSSCDRRLVKEAIDEIVADPSGGLSILPGDIEDSDRPSTRARKGSMFADRIEVLDAEGKIYLDYLDKEIIPMLLPLAKTKLGCVGILAGHHWKRLTKDLNSVQYICNRLSTLSGRKVPYLGQMSAWAWLRFHIHNKNGSDSKNRITKLLHVQHGEGGGQTLASALNKLELTSRSHEADVLIRAHDCKLVAGKFDRLHPKNTEGEAQILHKTVAMLNIGSFTRGFSLGTGEPDYPEMRMMRPTTMGYGKVHFDIKRASTYDDPNHNWEAKIRLEI